MGALPLRRVLRHPLIWGSVSAALLALVAWRSRAWELGDRLGDANGRPILAATLLCLVIIVAWAARSSALLGAAGRPVRIGPLIPMTAFANTINNLTPGSVGELARLYLLRVHHGVGYTTGTAVVIIERFVAIAYLGASAAILWLGWSLALPAPITIVGLAIVIALPSIAYRVGVRPSAAVRRLPLGRLLGRDRWIEAGSALARVDEAVADLLGHPGRTLVFALWTGIVFAAYTSQLLLVAAAVGQPLDPAAAWGALGLAIIAGVVSLLPFGLGSADLVLVALLGVAGMPAAEATAVAFGYRVVSTLPLSLLGVGAYALLSAGMPDGQAGGAARLAAEGLRADPPEPPA